MNRKSIKLLVLVSLSWAGLCHGAVFQHDWKTPGDGQLTYDDVSQREWLDLSQTVLANQFPQASDTEAKFQYVLAETNAGGLFEGFTAGKTSDVTALAQSAGINTSTTNYSLNRVPTLAFQQLVGITHVFQSQTYSIGMLDEFMQAFPTVRVAAGFNVLPTGTAGLVLSWWSPEVDSTPQPGVMLFRAVVPEPGVTFLATAAALIICSRRARRRN